MKANAIRARTVLGTSVKDLEGHRIGTVEDIVLDKQSNAIMFVIVAYGGILGVGERYHPIPWSALDYDDPQGTYVIRFTREQLEAAPSGSVEELTSEGGIRMRNRAYDYYSTPHYWS